uniref:RUN domain-containing protein n=1 Tax=Ciona savignyi TaxID=51511 RepID=H2Z5N0_CIOSA
MSLTDPLLKSLKYLIEEFLSVGENVCDESPYLEQFCSTVEKCFMKGIKQGQWMVTKDNGDSYRRKRFFQILEAFETNGPVPYTVSTAVTAAQQDKRLRSRDGRLRYLIRHCLTHSSLHVIVEFLMTRRTELEATYMTDDKQSIIMMRNVFGGGSSIMIHEQLSEQFRSLLLTCSTSLSFQLDLGNTYFLDETWKLPLIKTVEFVPTREIGIEMIYIQGHGIISRIKAGSLAADTSSLGVGDMLVEMNRNLLFPATIGGERDVRWVWRDCKRRNNPCVLTVVKPRSPITGGIYHPLKGILTEYHEWMDLYYKERQQKLDYKCLKDEIKSDATSPLNEHEKIPVLDPAAAENGIGGSFKVVCIGEVSTGDEGGVDQIESVIRQALNKRSARTSFDVTLTLTQIGVETEIR